MSNSRISQTAAALSFLLATAALTGVALADPIDNPGIFDATIALGAPPGGIQFLTFSSAATANLPAGAGTFYVEVIDGTTGEIDNGSYVFPRVPTSESYGGEVIDVIFEPGGSSAPIVGTVDAAHGFYDLTFEGRLRFRPVSPVTGFTGCTTARFTANATFGTGSLPPGSHSNSQIDLTAMTTSPGLVGLSSGCDASARAAINTAFGLASGTMTMYMWKATVVPDFEGSY